MTVPWGNVLYLFRSLGKGDVTLGDPNFTSS
jgi:hypothetical protein